MAQRTFQKFMCLFQVFCSLVLCCNGMVSRVFTLIVCYQRTICLLFFGSSGSRPYTRYFFASTIICFASIWTLGVNMGYLHKTLLVICITCHMLSQVISTVRYTHLGSYFWGQGIHHRSLCPTTVTWAVHTPFTHTPLRTWLIRLHSSTTITQCRGVYHYCCHIVTRYYQHARTIPRY